jgi:hypothetical protein
MNYYNYFFQEAAYPAGYPAIFNIRYLAGYPKRPDYLAGYLVLAKLK